MKIAPARMWAVLIMQPRSHWINTHTIGRTREEAAKAYLDFWLPEFREAQKRQRNKTWRTVRVSVRVEGRES